MWKMHVVNLMSRKVITFVVLQTYIMHVYIELSSIEKIEKFEH